MTKVRLYELIRKGRKLEGESVRALARRFGVHRRVVRAALDSAVPTPRKVTPREAPVLGEFHAKVRGWLEADRLAPKKQRHTARRIWKRLSDEHGCGAAESSVRRLVAALRRELATSLSQAFVPLLHEPGQEAEVDFYEATVMLGGVPIVLHHFCMRAYHSGREFHMAFPQLTQQAFLVGHNWGFAHFGGVFESVRYDNLRPAVKKVLQGRQRIETERFVALRGHYSFESVFCKPGKEGAHEKGGVEGGQGRFRRDHLTPVPAFENLTAYNAYLQACSAKDDLRVMEGRAETIAEAGIRELLELAFVGAGRPVIFLGGTGTGKTHLASALGYAACARGMGVKFITTAALVNELTEAADSRALSRVVGRYARVELLFQVVAERGERRATVVTTNLPFGEWTTIIPDPRLCRAFVERMTYRAHIIETGDESVRLDEMLTLARKARKDARREPQVRKRGG